ncbi:MAG: hypothetical protein ACTH58_04215 [Marinomonas foliarum]|uniref:hypothetical protein n=1 Tax=Marinomonas foliarum TaxID=491950 RepID=UPI003F960D7F
MSTTNEIGLYVTLFSVLFCMVVSFFTFLKFEGENIRKEGLSFTLSGIFLFIFVKPFKLSCSFLKEIFFSIINFFNKKMIEEKAKKITFLTSFLNFLIAPFKIIVVVLSWLKSIPKKIIYYEWKFPVHWDFGNLILIIGFLFVCVIYGGIFFEFQYKFNLFSYSVIFFILTFFSIFIFALQYGYEKIKYAFYVFVILNVVTITFSPYVTSDLFSSYSNVSPEKVTRLLYFMNVVSYVFCFYLLLYIVYYFLLLCLMCWKFYFFLYSKFDLFIEKPKQNTIRSFFTGNWIFVLLLLCFLGVPFVVFGKVLGSPSDRFEKIMSEYMFTENNGRCDDLEDDDKIYFYEQGRALLYIPKKVDQEADKSTYRMKYMDYKCKNDPKEEPTEAKVKEKAVLSFAGETKLRSNT